jgi:hypothetical protein
VQGDKGLSAAKVRRQPRPVTAGTK